MLCIYHAVVQFPFSFHSLNLAPSPMPITEQFIFQFTCSHVRLFGSQTISLVYQHILVSICQLIITHCLNIAFYNYLYSSFRVNLGLPLWTQLNTLSRNNCILKLLTIMFTVCFMPLRKCINFNYCLFGRLRLFILERSNGVATSKQAEVGQ